MVSVVITTYGVTDSREQATLRVRLPFSGRGDILAAVEDVTAQLMDQLEID